MSRAPVDPGAEQDSPRRRVFVDREPPPRDPARPEPRTDEDLHLSDSRAETPSEWSGAGTRVRGDTPEKRSREHDLLRRRVAGELHDGVLQVLTAIGVRLDAAREMIDSRPADAREIIAEVSRTVRAEQREIRMFVDEVKGIRDVSLGSPIPMERRVRAMLDRVAGLWGVSCDLECRTELPGEMDIGRTVLRLVQEATVNAIRHGNATRVAVRIRRAGDKLRLVVSDNGSGFTFEGRLDPDVLEVARLGPVFLARRVMAVGGHLRIVSRGEGTHVCICICLRDGSTDRPSVH